MVNIQYKFSGDPKYYVIEEIDHIKIVRILISFRFEACKIWWVLVCSRSREVQGCQATLGVWPRMNGRL